MSIQAAIAPMHQQAGRGQIIFTRTGDARTVCSRAQAASPMRLLTPRNAGHAAWVYVSNFGGGLLAGDELSLDIEVQPGAAGYVSSQSSTKIYRSPENAVSRQSLEARIADAGLLAVLPDPVVCYADARYAQKQRFEVAPSAGLVLLDWFTSGRHGRGERWRAAAFRSCNEIFINNHCVLRDVLQVDRPAPGGASRALDSGLGMNVFNCFATLVLVGNRVADAGKTLLERIAREPVRRGDPTPIGASPLRDNAGIVCRVAGRNVEEVAQKLFPHLGFVADLLGECPWRRKW